MNLTILSEYGTTPDDTELLEQAVALISEVTATKRFADLLMAAPLTETQGKANAQVLQDIDCARLQVSINLYDSWWSKVIGWTTLQGNIIHVNRKYFHGVVSIASNLLHEGSHILGYTHNGVWATSVPYTLNRIFEQVCMELNFGPQTALAQAAQSAVS